MKAAQPIRTATFGSMCVAAAAALVGAWLYGGVRGAEGMGLGLAGTTFSLGAGWVGIRWAGKAMADRPVDSQPGDEELEETLAFQRQKSKLINVLMGIVILLKLPVILGAWMLSSRIGGPASTTFLAGLGLVYCVLFGWALRQQ